MRSRLAVLGLVVVLLATLWPASVGVVAAQSEEYEGASFCRHAPAWPSGTYLGQMHPHHVDFYVRYAEKRGWDPCTTWATDQHASAVNGLRALDYVVVDWRASRLAAQTEEYEGASFCRHAPAWPNGTYLGQMHPHHVEFYVRFAEKRGWDPCTTWANDQRRSAIEGLRRTGFHIWTYGEPPQHHPDYQIIWHTARRRGASEAEATQIAADVIARGAVDAFLRGTLAGVSYGLADCQWRSPQCPLAPEGSPTTPLPPSGPTLPNHPQAALVRDTAVARGAAADVAVQIAADVIARGAVQAFLNGADSGAIYGVFDCQWRSPQCPLAAERPPPPKSPREQAAALVDPALMPALDMLKSVKDADGLDGETTTFALIVYLNMPVMFGALPPGSHGRINVAFGGELTARIVVNDAYRGESTRALATTLAHEMFHALAYAAGRLGPSWAECIESEIEAEKAAAWFWSKVRPGSEAQLTRLELGHEKNYLNWIDGTLEGEVRDRYRDTCAA